MKSWGLIAIVVGMAGMAAAPAAAQTSKRACTFETLTRAQQQEYGAAYQRRTREDGKAAADRWLRQRICPADTRRNAVQRGRSASSCKKTRVKNVLKPSYGGGMTLTPTLVCAD